MNVIEGIVAAFKNEPWLPEIKIESIYGFIYLSSTESITWIVTQSYYPPLVKWKLHDKQTEEIPVYAGKGSFGQRFNAVVLRVFDQKKSASTR